MLEHNSLSGKWQDLHIPISLNPLLTLLHMHSTDLQ